VLHETEGAIEGLVCEFFIEEMYVVPTAVMIVVLGRIHTLMMASNVSAE
jgi:hypothetical protein